MSAPFEHYFSNERPFWEKIGAVIREKRSLNTLIGRRSFKHRRSFEEIRYFLFILSFIRVRCVQLRYTVVLFKQVIGFRLEKTRTTLLPQVNFLIYYTLTWKILDLRIWTWFDFITWTWTWKVLGLTYWS